MKAFAIAVALALAVLPASAAAKTGLSLNPPPAGLRAGEMWIVQFQYIHNDMPANPRRGSHPSVRITNESTGAALTFPARLSHSGMWQAGVVFPQPGSWDYSIQGFGRRAERQFWDPAVIAARPRPATPAAVSTSGSGFPYGWVGVGLAAALAAVALLVRLRRA